MKQLLFSLFDTVAEQFGPIFQSANTNTAIRSVQSMKIRAHEDFKLYLVGEWDMESGRLKAREVSEFLRIEWASPTYKEEMKASQMELVK